MKVSTENLGNCQTVLTIEAEDGELDKSLDEAYHHLVNEVSIPGFRKGKAPRAILVQHIGKKNLLDEALEHLIPQLYKQAVESQELEPLARPEIEIIQTEPLVFKAVVSLKPEVKLGDYHSIRLEP
jgi:trigger factor